jgi:hypothetical protein
VSEPLPGASIAPNKEIDENPPLGQRTAERMTKRQRWTRRALIALAVLIYEIIWVVTAFDKVNPTDLDVFFFPATRYALAGHPLDIYQLRVGLIYPNANGPLGLAPVLLAAWLADLRGWLGDVMLRRALVFAISAPFPLLAGWEAARIVERVGGRLRGLASLLPYLLMAFAIELWLSALYYGHVEQIIAVWLTLVALRLLVARRAIASGALLGLALLARSDVALIILPIILTLLVRRQVKSAIWLAVGVVDALMAGLLPFLIADTRDTLFSLVAFRSALPVGGGNVWSLSVAHAFVHFGQRYDALLAIGVATLLTLVVLLVRRDLNISSPDMFGVLALSTLCFALLIKTLWPYYYQEAALFATVWGLARSVAPLRDHGKAWLIRIGALSLAWIPRLAILMCALAAEYGLEAVNYQGWLQPWGQILALLNLIIVTLTFGALLVGPRLNQLLTPDQESAPRDILPEMALSAPADG